MKNKKLLIILGCVMSISLMGVGIFSIANTIVDKSYSSREVVVKENTVNEGKEKPKSVNDSTESTEDSEVIEDTTPEVDFESIDEDTHLGNVKCLYDPTNLKQRQKDYLGSDYSKFESIFNACESGQIDWSDVPRDTSKISETNDYVIYSKDHVLNPDEIMTHDYVTIKYNLVIVGMYDNNKVIYSCSYPEYALDNLVIIVDYSETEFADSMELFDFGQGKTNTFSTKAFKELNIDSEFVVLLYRG